FGLAIAGKAVARRDLSYLAGCLFQVFGVLAQALHADAGRWLLNEKNAVAESAALPCAPARFGERVEQVFAGLGDPEAALGLARELVDEALTALPAG
ncbi:MAG: DNA polymerase subunit beta, partial [Nonomuraea sp.]|nr:DNA polymerase subunit beta [Nonomuraea sp.]